MKNSTAAKTKALLYDATTCVGCLECERACATQNGLPYDDAVSAEKATSAHKYTYVAVKPAVEGAEEKYMRRLCMHCQEPTCVSACPVGALQKTKDGPVTYDESKCMGCRYCMVACPFAIPKYEWAKVLPGVRKCIMCNDRVAAGGQTACAEACPTGATLFGDRDTLLADARKRIQENPGNYVNYIYGENEVGGTSVLMLSSVPFADFGLPMKIGTEPLPNLTADIIEHIPDVATVGMAVLGGIWWITNRRDLVTAAESHEEKEKE
jgi:formate dehydrogenase iron-sulfur subunit